MDTPFKDWAARQTMATAAASKSVSSVGSANFAKLEHRCATQNSTSIPSTEQSVSDTVMPIQRNEHRNALMIKYKELVISARGWGLIVVVTGFILYAFIRTGVV